MAISDLVYNKDCNCCNDEAQMTLKSAFTRFQEVAASKEEIKLMGLSDKYIISFTLF